MTLADQQLNDPRYGDRLLEAEDTKSETLAALAHHDEPVLVRHTDDSYDVEAQYASHMNRVGLTASDLVAVGWDSDKGNCWTNERHGGEHTYLDACKIEADRIDPEPELPADYEF